jgi:hypothetical protein
LDGLPLVLSDDRPHGAAIMSVELAISYDPSLLTFTEVALGPDAPAGATLDADLNDRGRVTLSVTSDASFEGTALRLVEFTAQVIAAIPYGRSGELVVSDLVVAGAADAAVAATADRAVFVTALFGDATGNGSYSGLDAQRVARVVVELDTGLDAFLTVDPLVIGDVTGNGALSGLDAQRIAQKVVDLDPPEIPPLPQPLADGAAGNRMPGDSAPVGVPAQVFTVPAEQSPGLPGKAGDFATPQLAAADAAEPGVTSDFAVASTRPPGGLAEPVAFTTAVPWFPVQTARLLRLPATRLDPQTSRARAMPSPTVALPTLAESSADKPGSFRRTAHQSPRLAHRVPTDHLPELTQDIDVFEALPSGKPQDPAGLIAKRRFHSTFLAARG